MNAPKLFISYSWSSPEHEAWVIRFATELRESGIDVILDKWDLKEGDDAHAFMERMVTDPGIKKVILICNRIYTQKANERTGGVGTEAQIISGEIYSKQKQDKFVAVIKELDDHGHAYVPAYYKSRIFIDMSDDRLYSKNFDQVLRWAYDKPLFKKPELGRIPSFILEDHTELYLATTTHHRRAINSIRNNQQNAIPTTIEYLSCLASELNKIYVASTSEANKIEEIDKSISSFLPYRNEAVDIFYNLALYNNTEESGRIVHHFFEEIFHCTMPPRSTIQFNIFDFDNFKFFVQELFLYAFACFIKHNRFIPAAYLINNEYLISGLTELGRNKSIRFTLLRSYLESLEVNKPANKANLTFYQSILLKERCKDVLVDFTNLMQADFLLFICDHIRNDKGAWCWFPDTLFYAEDYHGAFELFIRCRSKTYFEKVKNLLGIKSKDDLIQIITDFQSRERSLPKWGYKTLHPNIFLGLKDLATMP